MHPEIPKREPRGQLVFGECPRRLAHQHLATVRGTRDAGGPVDVDPDVVAVRQQATLARVHTHPNADRMREWVICQRSLDVGGGLKRVAWPPEDNEEGVALSSHLDP